MTMHSRRTQSPWLTLLAALAVSASAPAGAAVRDGAAGPTAEALGGGITVLRYAVAQPDRSETALLFLAAPRTPGAPPEQVQVVGAGGEQLQLADAQGADCTLERVWIRRARRGGPEIVYARRTFGGDLKADVASEPAPMEVDVFRLRPGAEPGDSARVLHIVGAARRTAPVCRAGDVMREMARLSPPPVAR